MFSTFYFISRWQRTNSKKYRKQIGSNFGRRSSFGWNGRWSLSKFIPIGSFMVTARHANNQSNCQFGLGGCRQQHSFVGNDNRFKPKYVTARNARLFSVQGSFRGTHDLPSFESQRKRCAQPRCPLVKIHQVLCSHQPVTSHSPSCLWATVCD